MRLDLIKFPILPRIEINHSAFQKKAKSATGETFWFTEAHPHEMSGSIAIKRFNGDQYRLEVLPFHISFTKKKGEDYMLMCHQDLLFFNFLIPASSTGSRRGQLGRGNSGLLRHVDRDSVGQNFFKEKEQFRHCNLMLAYIAMWFLKQKKGRIIMLLQVGMDCFSNPLVTCIKVL